jgi:hypothetical protein
MKRKLEARHIEVVDPQMAAIYREMSTEQKGLIVAEAHETMRAMLKARIQFDHPDWSPQAVDREIARRLLGDAARVLETRG